MKNQHNLYLLLFLVGIFCTSALGERLPDTDFDPIHTYLKDGKEWRVKKGTQGRSETIICQLEGDTVISLPRNGKYQGKICKLSFSNGVQEKVVLHEQINPGRIECYREGSQEPITLHYCEPSESAFCIGTEVIEINDIWHGFLGKELITGFESLNVDSPIMYIYGIGPSHISLKDTESDAEVLYTIEAYRDPDGNEFSFENLDTYRIQADNKYYFEGQEWKYVKNITDYYPYRESDQYELRTISENITISVVGECNIYGLNAISLLYTNHATGNTWTQIVCSKGKVCYQLDEYTNRWIKKYDYSVVPGDELPGAPYFRYSPIAMVSGKDNVTLGSRKVTRLKLDKAPSKYWVEYAGSENMIDLTNAWRPIPTGYPLETTEFVSYSEDGKILFTYYEFDKEGADIVNLKGNEKSDITNGLKFDLYGRVIEMPAKGQLYISNGKVAIGQ